MMTDPDPAKKKTDTQKSQDSNETPYVEPEAIDTQEPEDLNSDEENV
jgi:hypothetical protein